MYCKNYYGFLTLRNFLNKGFNPKKQYFFFFITLTDFKNLKFISVLYEFCEFT